MTINILLEHRFQQTPDGAIWTGSTFPYPFWSRYLAVFDRVRVLARVLETSTVPSHWKRSDGDGVSFFPLPYYVGPLQYLVRRRELGRIARGGIGPGDAILLRVPSPLASSLAPLLHGAGRPYGLEVIGDPSDVFAPGVVRHPLRPLFRWWLTHQLRSQCSKACALSYVTAQALQRRYPSPPGSFSLHCSDVTLEADDFVEEPRPSASSSAGGRFKLVMVGSLAQLYKAPDILIDAIALCIKKGLELEVVIVGDGKYRPALEKQAQRRGIADRVRFTGLLASREAVREQLDCADLFVLPSRTEGLPAALVEAMARALPCIGSTAGGIPELLSSDDLVPPGSASALASKIQEFLSHPDRLARMSARNLETALHYREELLTPRRNAFYGHLREKTEEWLQQHPASTSHRPQRR